jgi:hypothetical protein
VGVALAPEQPLRPCRSDRRRAVGALMLALLTVATGGIDAAQPTPVKTPASGDWITHPPVREEFVSADGRQRLVISSIDEQGWKSQRSSAEMQRAERGIWRSQWRLDLPHAYRPRFALATPKGAAVFLDEWINIRSPLAIMVIGPDGRGVAVTHVDAVFQLLGVPGSDVVAVARYGVWMQAPPVLSADGQQVEVRTAGKVLRVRLSDGALSLA